jgi:hypothetical protein
LVSWRTETYPNGSRNAEFVFPFWQRWEKVDADERHLASYAKLWPLWQTYTEGESGRTALPALNSALAHAGDRRSLRVPVRAVHARVDRRGRERALVGRLVAARARCHGAPHLCGGIWARRLYVRDGVRRSETSVLFGLLRWRRSDGHFEGFLKPALPGPGFPHQRSREPLASESGS